MKDMNIACAIRYFLALLLCCAAAFACTGCGGGGKEDVLLEDAGEECGKADGRSLPGADEAPRGDTAALAEEKPVVVYVCGAVNSPGVYTLKADSRVYQALESAGGIKDDGCGEILDQARLLKDGEKIYVPTKKEAEGLSAMGAGGSLYPMGASGPEKVNINTASKEQLMALPGIGESKAGSIISFRERSGGFGSIEEIKNVDGIKEGLYEKLKDRIVV